MGKKTEKTVPDKAVGLSVADIARLIDSMKGEVVFRGTTTRVHVRVKTGEDGVTWWTCVQLPPEIGGSPLAIVKRHSVGAAAKAVRTLLY